MDLHKLDIDKYLDWYSGITDKIEEAPQNSEKAGRYLLASYYLHNRFIRNSNNKRSLEYSDLFKQQGQKIEMLVELVAVYEMPAFRKLFRVLSPGDWVMFKYSRKSFLNTDIENFEQTRETTPLPEMTYIEHTLQKISTERPFKYLDFYVNVQPLPVACELTNFVYEISTIDFIKYLYAEKNKIESAAIAQSQTINRLSWKADKKDLSELVKALALTGFAGTPETEIVKAFERITEYKGQPLDLSRHEINKNELQDRKPRDLFTAKMNKAINDFFQQKLSPNE